MSRPKILDQPLLAVRIHSSVFKYFDHQEVLTRISSTESDRIRVCIERDEVRGTNRLLAITNPSKPIVYHEDLTEILRQYDGQNINYADGVFDRHTCLASVRSSRVGGDAFTNRFVLSTPIDGFDYRTFFLACYGMFARMVQLAMHEHSVHRFPWKRERERTILNVRAPRRVRKR